MKNSEFERRMRESRSSSAVLKVQISNIRSRNQSAVIAVVEGVTDVGPYEVWSKRVDQNLKLEFLPATGKTQVLDFRQRIRGDQSGVGVGIYMFVDRDFDGLRGQKEGDDIFCTKTYSIENYLVSESILRSVLMDEFRCTAETDHRDNIVKLFADVLLQFNRCIADANRKIYNARRLGFRKKCIDKKISKYVDISHFKVEKVYDEDLLKELVSFEKEPSAEETDGFDAEFDRLNPLLNYRGKFVLAFFIVWLDKLSDEGKRPNQTLFPDEAKVRFSASSLTLRSLATRSCLPSGLEQFVRNMKSPMSQLAP